jgi:hypothetical protein
MSRIAQPDGVAHAGRRWLDREWVTRRHIDLQRVHSALCWR